MSELPGSPLGGGRQFKVHGFEVVVHTTRVLAERSLGLGALAGAV